MSLKTGNSRRVAKSRPVCMGLYTHCEASFRVNKSIRKTQYLYIIKVFTWFTIVSFHLRYITFLSVVFPFKIFDCKCRNDGIKSNERHKGFECEIYKICLENKTIWVLIAKLWIQGLFTRRYSSWKPFTRVRTKLESPWMSLNLKTNIQGLEYRWIRKEVLESP
jgi:hypothetical protein